MSQISLDDIIRNGESATVEFKANIDNLGAVGEAVCSFLNGKGGTLVIGVNDERHLVGVEHAPGAAKTLQKYLFEHISPKAPCSVSVEAVQSHRVLLIDVPAGQEQPHVFVDQIFIREGCRSRQAQPAEIINLIKHRAARPTTWERHPAPGAELSDLDKDLVLETAAMAAKRGLKLTNADDPMEVLRQLSLTSAGYILNSAIVLFGKQPQQRFPQTRVRAAVFQKDKKGEFIDRRDFEGNLFILLHDLESFLRKHIPVAASFSPERFQRKDTPEYPFAALDEAVLNALVHRDYSDFTGSVSVEIYPDQISIWNPGRLPSGLAVKDLGREHPSLPRNPDIAQVVYLRGLIERVGRGTQSIISECLRAGLVRPTWKEAPAGITLSVFGRKSPKARSIKPNVRQVALLERLKPGESLLPADYFAQTDQQVSRRQAQSDLLRLVQMGFLDRHGATTAAAYVRTDKAWP
jgi:ATP-dependent DNA helicase RecG